MDDTFLRAVSALQANLKLLDSQQGALSDFQDMQVMRRLKTELAEYIEGHAAKGGLPADPLSIIIGRLETLKRFFHEAESESQRLLDWRADWLKGIPHVSLEDLQQARTELGELERQVPAMQEKLRGGLDPHDWYASGGQPALHPELWICAETMPRLALPSISSCAALWSFAHGTGERHEQVLDHLRKISQRIDELLRLHTDHLSKIAEAGNHLAKENFRSAEKVMGALGKGKFADIDYPNTASRFKKQMALFKRFAELDSTIDERLAKGEFTAIRKELQALEHESFIPGSELAAETSALVVGMKGTLASHLRRRKKRRWITATVIVLLSAAGATLTSSLIQEYKRLRQAAAEEKAKAEREAAEAKAKAEREAAEAKAKAAALYEKFRGARDGEEKVIQLATGVTMTLCWCPPGDFTMGSPASEEGRSSDEDQVKVTLAKGFWMAKTEVTQAQWQAVMGTNPSYFKGATLPVEEVSWGDAQEFLKKLNARLGSEDSGIMALPTEAQWEYAARAGLGGTYSGGPLDQVAWHGGNSGGTTHAVGTKKANAWGLHDMSGNVWELCADWYGDDIPGEVDPKGPASGVYRVRRGGSWVSGAAECRAARRLTGIPVRRDSLLGFRPALVPSE